MHVLFAGSFDPVTVGHERLVRRAAALFDRVTVGVFHNVDKQDFFLPQERAEMLRAAFAGMENVDVCVSDGYVADYCAAHGIDALVRGLRTAADLPGERAGEHYNRTHGMETLFLLSEEGVADVSSTEVRRRMERGEKWQDLVPAGARERICVLLHKKSEAAH